MKAFNSLLMSPKIPPNITRKQAEVEQLKVSRDILKEEFLKLSAELSMYV